MNKKGDIKTFLLGCSIIFIIIMGFCIYCAYQDFKPMILYQFSGWGPNINDTTQYLFEGTLLNFGNTEGKNIELTCKIMNKKDVLITNTKNIGNIASNSLKLIEVSLPNQNEGKQTTGICYVSNCSGCLNLIDRIPELTEEYK